MESMGFFAFFLAVIALARCTSLNTQVRELKYNIHGAGIGHTETASLREILEKSIGKTADLKIETIGLSFGASLSDCQILEVDEEWALVLTGKKQEKKLVRIQSIRGVNLKG